MAFPRVHVRRTASYPSRAGTDRDGREWEARSAPQQRIGRSTAQFDGGLTRRTPISHRSAAAYDCSSSVRQSSSTAAAAPRSGSRRCTTRNRRLPSVTYAPASGPATPAVPEEDDLNGTNDIARQASRVRGAGHRRSERSTVRQTTDPMTKRSDQQSSRSADFGVSRRSRDIDDADRSGLLSAHQHQRSAAGASRVERPARCHTCDLLVTGAPNCDEGAGSAGDARVG